MEQTSVIDALNAAVPGAKAEAVPSVDMETILVAREAIIDVCRFLKTDPAFQFEFLADILGVDLLPQEPRFEIVYLLACLGPAFTSAGAASPAPARRLRVKTQLPAADARVDTVSSVWPSANWPEREIFDLFGVAFNDHPNLRRILMTDDWEGHPLRKDYPVQIRKSGHIPWEINVTPEQFAANVAAGREKAAAAARKPE
jgi:NADH-quinone oxidoreductase subunit C